MMSMILIACTFTSLQKVISDYSPIKFLLICVGLCISKVRCILKLHVIHTSSSLTYCIKSSLLLQEFNVSVRKSPTKSFFVWFDSQYLCSRTIIESLFFEVIQDEQINRNNFSPNMFTL